MQIRMTVGLSGPAYNLSPGDIWDFPDDEAARLIAAGFAVPVADVPIERAVINTSAPSVERRGKKKP